MFGSRVKNSVVNVKDNHVYDSGNTTTNNNVNASGNVDVTIFNVAKGHKRAKNEHFEILTLLSEVDYEQHHKFISSARQDKTGKWPFKKPDFIAWGTSTSSIFWLHGIDGAVKTMLA
ncbi:hypothetical protein RUND412_004693 [Rhizina undulata]